MLFIYKVDTFFQLCLAKRMKEIFTHKADQGQKFFLIVKDFLQIAQHALG